MLYSRLFARSSKNEGANLSVRSHRLLVQAGYIRESVAGRYYFLPLGRKVQLKLMALIRQEMEKAGAQEILVPILHPLKLWQETNRDAAVGFELMQLKDRRGTGFALGGTAEEMLVDLVRKFNLSYKDLPFNLYQFGFKFRDELRARGGLLRVREFIMKDAYSFSTEKQFEAVYEQMRQTYQTIFDRVGLPVKVVAADGGYIGGEYCHEFVADAEVGESLYFQSDSGYIAHEDIAVFDKAIQESEDPEKDLRLVPAERNPTMKDSFNFHRPAPLEQHIKNVVYLNENKQIVLACLRGDLDVNEIKLKKAAQCHQLEMLTAEQIESWLGSAAGFISAVGLEVSQPEYKLLIVADDSILTLKNAISGANKLNHDYLNINFKRDFQAEIVADIALAKAGYKATDGGVLTVSKGIEVGNIFQLGYHYSAEMKGAEYVDRDGKLQKYYMGCYGIGIGRTIAAIAEINSDDHGLVWPVCLTPYHIYAIDLAVNEQSRRLMQDLQTALPERGLDILYDDRSNISAGEKLANADSLGLPIRLVISPKTLVVNQVEIKARLQQTVQLVAMDQVATHCLKLLDSRE